MNKTDLSTPAQKWRMVVFILLILTFASTLIPGTYVYCAYHPEFYPDNTNHYFYNYTYNPVNVVTLQIMLEVLVGIVLSFISIKRRNNRLLLWVILLCGIALFWVYKAYIIQGTLWCMSFGHGLKWLPFVPPILLAVSMVAAVVAWFVGLREEKKQ